MDVLNSLSLNGANFIVHDSSTYALNRHLDSDYGFELYWRRKRGAQELKWRQMLNRYGFHNVDVWPGKSYLNGETHVDTLDLVDFIVRPFVVHWVFGGEWYGLGFDGNEFHLQDNHNNIYLPNALL